MVTRIEIIDSHTAGEPTRVVLAGGPDLGNGPLSQRRDIFRERFDRYRTATVCEPRGSEVLVGALLVPPVDPSCAVGVIFFNNVGYIGMCGHGAIGVVETLAHLGRVSPGAHRLETPVGTVAATLHADGRVTIGNVASYRKSTKTVNVPGIGEVTGDIAWGGNWFYLVENHGQQLALENVAALTEYTWRIRRAINAQGHPEIDHIELFGDPTSGLPPPASGLPNSRNFVLCPGGAYDRSPCGTGTSAKLACLAVDGKLAPGETWIQESILGTTFAASYQWLDKEKGTIAPSITGRAHITATATLIVSGDDAQAWGF